MKNCFFQETSPCNWLAATYQVQSQCGCLEVIVTYQVTYELPGEMFAHITLLLVQNPRSHWDDATAEQHHKFMCLIAGLVQYKNEDFLNGDF